MDRLHRSRPEKTNRVILPVLGRFRDEVYAKEQKSRVSNIAAKQRRQKLIRRAGLVARLGGGAFYKKKSQEDEIASLHEQIADELETSRRMIRFDFDTERKAKEAEITSTKAEVDDVNLQIIECERKLRHLASEKKEHALLHEQAIDTIGRHERECTKLEAVIPRQNAMICTLQAHHKRIQVEYGKTRIKYNVARERHSVGARKDSVASYGNMFHTAGFVYGEAAMKDINVRKSELLLTIRSRKRTLGSMKKIHSDAMCALKTQKRRAEYICVLGGNGKEALPSYEAHFEKGAMKKCVQSLRMHMQLDHTATSWKPWNSDIRTVVLALRGLFSKSDGFNFRRLMQKVDIIDVTPLAEALGSYLRGNDDKEWSALDRLDALRRQLDMDSRVKKKILGYLLKRKRVWREYVRQYHNRRTTFEIENDLVLKKLTHHVSELENQVIRLEGEVESFAHSSYFGEKTWRATVHKFFQDEVTNLQHRAKNDALDIVLLEEKNDVAIFETIAEKTRETAALMADMRLKIQHHGPTHRKISNARLPPDYGRSNKSKTRAPTIPLAYLLQDGVPYVCNLFLSETHDVGVQTTDEYAFFEDIYKSEKVVVTQFNEEEIAVRVMGGDILFYYAKVSDIAMLFENYADTWASIGEKIAQSIEIICDTGPRLFLPMPPLVDEGWTLSPTPSLGIQEATVVVSTACCIHDTVYAVTVYELRKYYAFRLYNPTGTPEISWTRAWIHTVLRSLDFSSCEQFRRCEDIQRRVSRFLQEKLGSLPKQTKRVSFPLHLQEQSKHIGLTLDSYSDETFGCQFFPVNTIKGRWQATVQNQLLRVLRAQKRLGAAASPPELTYYSPKLSRASSVCIDDEDWTDDWTLCSDDAFDDDMRSSNYSVQFQI